MYVRILLCAVVAISLCSLIGASTTNYMITMCQKPANNNFYLAMFDPTTGSVVREQLIDQSSLTNDVFWDNAAVAGIHLASDGTFILQLVGTWNGGTLLRTYQTNSVGLDLFQYTDSLVYNDPNLGLTSICGRKGGEALWTQAYSNGAFVSLNLKTALGQSSTTTYTTASGYRAEGDFSELGNLASNPNTGTLDNFWVGGSYSSSFSQYLYYAQADVSEGTYSVQAPVSVSSSVPLFNYNERAFDAQEFSTDGSTIYSLAQDSSTGHINLVSSLNVTTSPMSFNSPISGTNIGSYSFCSGLTNARNPCSGVSPITPAPAPGK